MKKKYFGGVTIVVALFLMLVTSCNKETLMSSSVLSSLPSVQHKQKEFRDTVLYDYSKPQRAKQKFASRTLSPTDTVVLFLDFDGGTNIPGEPWQIPNNFDCPSSDLEPSQKDSILRMVREDYSPFMVKVTTDPALYQQATGAKMICYITRKNAPIQQSPVLGPIAAVAYTSSILWGDGTPCFVFVDALEFNAKYVAEATSHELGHTFGCTHDELHDANCNSIGLYLPSNGDGPLSRGSIMGNPYAASLTNFIVDPCSGQDAAAIIASIAGWRPEPVGDATHPISGGTFTVVLNPTNGFTAPLIHPSSRHTFSKPASMGTKWLNFTSNGNVDLALEVRDSATGVPTLIDNPDSPDVEVVLSGSKLVTVLMSTNQPYPMYSGQPWVYTAGGSYTIKVLTPIK